MAVMSRGAVGDLREHAGGRATAATRRRARRRARPRGVRGAGLPRRLPARRLPRRRPLLHALGLPHHPADLDDLVRDRFSLEGVLETAGPAPAARAAGCSSPSCCSPRRCSSAPTELASGPGEAFATLGYVANWWQIATSSTYFASYATPSPLHHTWSLAIEEQIYVLWPLLVLAVWRIGRRRIGLIGVVAAALASASLIEGALLYRTADDGARVYYGTDTRAASVLIGAIAAIVVWRFGPVLQRWRSGGLVRQWVPCRRPRVGPRRQRRVALRGRPRRARGAGRAPAVRGYDATARRVHRGVVGATARRHRYHQLRRVPVPLAVSSCGCRPERTHLHGLGLFALRLTATSPRRPLVLPDRASVPSTPLGVLVARRSARFAAVGVDRVRRVLVAVAEALDRQQAAAAVQTICESAGRRRSSSFPRRCVRRTGCSSSVTPSASC